MKEDQYETKIIVLRKKLEENSAREIVEEKKTKVFRSLLRSPKKEDVHIHSLKLVYESFLIISGEYAADYYRKAEHMIKVDYNVKDVVLGDGVFPAKTRSGVWKKLGAKGGKNKVELRLEEHVFVKEEDKMVFDHHGKEIRFPFKINSKTVENYPKKLLAKNKENVKKPEIKYEAAIEKLSLKLKKPLELEVRDLHDEFTVNEISEVYVPIYEARLVGPKKKVALLRIDAIRRKVL